MADDPDRRPCDGTIHDFHVKKRALHPMGDGRDPGPGADRLVAADPAPRQGRLHGRNLGPARAKLLTNFPNNLILMRSAAPTNVLSMRSGR